MVTAENQTIRFITSVYGKKYGGMLLNLLYSVIRSNKGARMTVYWQDVAPDVVSLKDAFPEFDFIDTSHNLSSDLVDRIAHKTLLWADAAARYKGEHLVFVDVDMLVVRDVRHFFDSSFDIAFTYKDETYPINTGTFLARASDATEAFFKAWDKRTQVIVHDESLRDQATSRSHPYGAPDQMAFYEMIGFQKGRADYDVSVGSAHVRCVGFSCEELNETNSRPLNDRMHIIHYKGGWHSILIDGTDFTPRRSRADSWEMYLLYLRTYQEAVGYAAERLGDRMSKRDFGITRPFYLDASLHASEMLYELFSFKEKMLTPIREFSMRVRRKLSR